MEKSPYIRINLIEFSCKSGRTGRLHVQQIRLVSHLPATKLPSSQQIAGRHHDFQRLKSGFLPVGIGPLVSSGNREGECSIIGLEYLCTEAGQCIVVAEGRRGGSLRIQLSI